MKKVGYHYTSIKNWELIKKTGLQRGAIDKPELHLYFDLIPNGVWIWREELSPQSEVGSILFQLSSKGSLQVVKLEVTYDTEDVLKWRDHTIKLTHSGSIGDWHYHEEAPDAIILTRDVPLRDIKLLATFDIMSILKTAKKGA